MGDERSVNGEQPAVSNTLGIRRVTGKPIESPNKSRPRDTKMRLLRGIPPNAAWTTRLWWTRLSASLIQNEPAKHAASFSWLCNCARIHQSLSHCLGILITQQRMQFGDYYFELAHAQLNLPTHVVTMPSRLSPLTPAGLTLNQNLRADWNLCHVSCTILAPCLRAAMAGHWGGPRGGSWSSVTLSSWSPDKPSRSPHIRWFPHNTHTSQSRSCHSNPPNCHPLRLGLPLSHKLRDRWPRRWLVKHHFCWSCCIQDTSPSSPHRRTRAKPSSTQQPWSWPCNGTGAWWTCHGTSLLKSL